MTLNKTFLPNQNYDNRTWFVIDCKNQKVGRLATFIVNILKGKIKSQYYPSIDIGDYIILINAQAIIINNITKHYIVNKPGRPGKALKIHETKNMFPKVIIERAVKRMLSLTETKRLMRRLYIYNTSHHPHYSQNPVPIDLTNITNI